MSQHRARIVRHIVNQDSAGSTFGAVAAQLRSREAQLVSQCPCQRFLLHNVGPPQLAIDVYADEPVSRRAGGSQSGSTEQIARRTDSRAAGDDTFDKSAPGYGSRFVYHSHVRTILHLT